MMHYISPWVSRKIQHLFEYEVGNPNIKKLGKGKRRIFLIDLPIYGNLGDQAIGVSELAFLKVIVRNLVGN